MSKQKVDIREGQHHFSANVPGHGLFEATANAYRSACRRTKDELVEKVCGIYEGTPHGEAHWRTFRKEVLALIVASCNA